jgi:uncharacterized repeat protein (TIGR01451 family)
VVLPAAGDGGSFTKAVVPGIRGVSEAPAGDTNAADYRSTVVCRRKASRRGARAGTVSGSITLAAGEQGLCTFRNIRPGVPAIAIRKTGPDTAAAGDTLHYTLLVTNPGDVPFPEAAVTVTDPACDGAPELVDKQDGSGPDGSPGTLDPLVDTWTYRCSRKTAAPGADCVQTRVDNAGTVTGAADGKTVEDSDSISTILTCPDQPEPPIPVPPNPEPPNPPTPNPPGPEPPTPDVPGPVVPPGPTPPDAGDSGVAGIVVRSPLRRCIRSHVPRVTFSGDRVRSVRVYVNGHRVRSLNLRTLQSTARPRVTLAPGRYRVTARVTFQPGSATPGVSLSRVVRVCAAAALAPRFTG